MTIGDMAFNGFDIVVLGVVLISLLMAASRGLLRELVSIVALVVGIAVGLFMWGQFRVAAQEAISPPWLADGALALGSFAFAYMIVVFALRTLIRDKGTPSLPNRLLGAAFGAFRGLVVMALFVLVPTASYIADRDRLREEERDLAERTDVPPDIRERLLTPQQELPEWLESSSTYPILERIGDVIRTLPFGEMREAADDLRDGTFPGSEPEMEDL